MAGLVPATSRLPSPACILCSSSAVKFFGGFLTCTRAYLLSGLSLATNTAATRMFMQYAANQCIMRIYALIPVPQDRRRIAIAMVSRLHSYIIALRSLWYRASKAMVSHRESYVIAPRQGKNRGFGPVFSRHHRHFCVFRLLECAKSRTHFCHLFSSFLTFREVWLRLSAPATAGFVASISEASSPLLAPRLANFVTKV